VIVSPRGKITRYMYGAEYLPADLKMALAESKKEIASPTIARLLEFCFSYDPEGRSLVLNVTRVVGLSTILGIASVALFISASGKRRKQKVG
jgi:protein SCO1/2